MQGEKASWRSPDHPREHRHGGKDAAPIDQAEARARREVEILSDRPIARVLGRTRGPNQPASEGKVDARLQELMSRVKRFD